MAPSKRAFADALKSPLQRRMIKRLAAEERVFSDFGNGGRNGDRLQLPATVKCLEADPLEVLPQGDGFEFPTITERFVTDLGTWFGISIWERK